jgi:CheY-like chemotaxis protein
MARRAEQLRDRIIHLADPELLLAFPTSEKVREHLRTLQHDLRGPAAILIGVCQDWQEADGSFAVEPFLPALTHLRERAESLLGRIQKLVGFRLAMLAESGPADEGLQAVIDDLGRMPRRTAARSAPTSRNGRLLLVDDDRDSRERLARGCAAGHQVTEVSGGREAAERIAENPSQFDAVLLDVVMPDMHGPQVLQRLKAEEAWRYLPVIMVTAHDVNHGDNVVVNCIARGAEDYLIRPVPPDLLRARVGACLEKKRLRDREMEHVQRIDDLLHAIIPHELVEDLKRHGRLPSVVYQDVGVLFLDIVGFTAFCQSTPAEEVVRRLNGQVLAFERITKRHGVQKIKTVGDAFMATAGLPHPCPMR